MYYYCIDDKKAVVWNAGALKKYYFAEQLHTYTIFAAFSDKYPIRILKLNYLVLFWSILISIPYLFSMRYHKVNTTEVRIVFQLQRDQTILCYTE